MPGFMVRIVVGDQIAPVLDPDLRRQWFKTVAKSTKASKTKTSAKKTKKKTTKKTSKKS